MKVLANDGLGKEGVDYFVENGFEVEEDKRDPEQLIKDIKYFDVLVVRSATKVTAEVIKAGYSGQLQIVGRAGVGYDNVETSLHV